jgi:hypothetical protein
LVEFAGRAVFGNLLVYGFTGLGSVADLAAMAAVV